MDYKKKNSSFWVSTFCELMTFHMLAASGFMVSVVLVVCFIDFQVNIFMV